MSLKDLFKTDSKRCARQDNWLKMVGAIPGVKQAFDESVSAEDEAVAAEARDILASKNPPSDNQ